MQDDPTPASVGDHQHRKAGPVGGEEHQGLPKDNSGPGHSPEEDTNLLQDGILVEIRKNKDLARAKWGVDHWKELII